MSNNMHCTYIAYTTYRRCKVLDDDDDVQIRVFVCVTGETCEDEGNLEDVWRKRVKTRW